MYGFRLVTAARRWLPPAPGIGEKTVYRQGDTRSGHIPTPPRPRPDRARPALPQELAATFWTGVMWRRRISGARRRITQNECEPHRSNVDWPFPPQWKQEKWAVDCGGHA